MRALIIGATGATGKDLVKVLLKHPDYTQVCIFVRSSMGISHRKLLEVITDFDELENYSEHITGDVWFSCMGTTLKAAGSKDNQWAVDYCIPLSFAQIAKRNHIEKVVLVSAYGASAKSRVFYSRMKGQLEDDIASIGFVQLTIFRPGALIRKGTNRWSERLSVCLLNVLNEVGLMKKFRPLPTLTLSEKLAKAPKFLPAGKHVIELEDIFYF